MATRIKKYHFHYEEKKCPPRGNKIKPFPYSPYIIDNTKLRAPMKVKTRGCNRIKSVWRAKDIPSIGSMTRSSMVGLDIHECAIKTHTAVNENFSAARVECIGYFKNRGAAGRGNCFSNSESLISQLRTEVDNSLWSLDHTAFQCDKIIKSARLLNRIELPAELSVFLEKKELSLAPALSSMSFRYKKSWSGSWSRL